MRLIGVNIPDAKRIEVALTYVFGVGPNRARRALEATKVDPDKRAKDLSPEEGSKIKELENKAIELEGKKQKIEFNELVKIEENLEKLGFKAKINI